MLKTRIITALWLAPLMLAALFLFSPVAWVLFSGLVIGLALWEYTRLLKMQRVAQVGYLLLTFVLAIWAWRAQVTLPVVAQWGVLAFWGVVVPLWLRNRWQAPKGWLAAILGWVMMFPAWFAMLDWHPSVRQGMQLLLLMALVWVADVAAYFCGKAWGKTKLAPSISPGKSREGVYGAIIIVAIYAALVSYMHAFSFQLAPWLLVLLAIILTLVSVAGDLLESWFKRCAGIKDSSQLLPGHGGVYDRIDSLIAVLAVTNALRIIFAG